MKTKIILLISLIILASCGSRKSAIDTYKANVTIKDKVAIKVDSTEKTSTVLDEKERTKFNDQKDIVKKDIKTEVKEVFQDGKLTERTTTTTISDLLDKSNSQYKGERDVKATTLKDVARSIESTATKVVDSLIKSKNKKIEADKSFVKNIGGWPVIVFICLFIFVLAAIWFWWQKRKK